MCVRQEVSVQLHSHMWTASGWIYRYPTPSVEKAIFPPWDGLGALVKNQGTTNVKVYFWALNSIPGIPVSIHVLDQGHLQPWESGGRETLRILLSW